MLRVRLLFHMDGQEFAHYENVAAQSKHISSSCHPHPYLFMLDHALHPASAVHPPHRLVPAH
jgi:hypothetical protein